jgi:hypothetical protein
VRFTSRAVRKMPTLDQFIESLMLKKDKLIKMGTIKGFNVHALVVHKTSSTFNPKSKKKGKGKVHSKQNKEGNSKPFKNSSKSKGGKGKKGVDLHSLINVSVYIHSFSFYFSSHVSCIFYT